MNDNNGYALRIRDLGKRYIVGRTSAEPKNFSKLLLRSVVAPFQRLASTFRGDATLINQRELWAIRDINLDIKRGEILGVIGRNGAGKSTFLKVLSRITAPTTGCAEIYGSYASLLEVGAAFHIDLSARDNIYLHGSIYGRSKRETDAVFDEIVEFAELQDFVDTQVKRYSSGMYSRLAFSVAAHFEAEVLLIDEILATGDAKFVKKCLRRMENIAEAGRTVIFVSHSLASVADMCTRAILLEQGKVISDGEPHTIISEYMHREECGSAPEKLQELSQKIWDEGARPTSPCGTVSLRSIRAFDSDGNPVQTLDISLPWVVEVDYVLQEPVEHFDVCLSVKNSIGNVLFTTMSHVESPCRGGTKPRGGHTDICRFPANFFYEETISIDVELRRLRPLHPLLRVTDAIMIKMTETPSENPTRGDWEGHWPPSQMRPCLSWEYKED